MFTEAQVYSQSARPPDCYPANISRSGLHPPSPCTDCSDSGLGLQVLVALVLVTVHCSFHPNLVFSDLVNSLFKILEWITTTYRTVPRLLGAALQYPLESGLRVFHSSSADSIHGGETVP